MYLLLVIGNWNVSYIQVGVLSFITVGTSERYFESFVLYLISVERLDCFARVFLVQVLDEAVAKAVTLKLNLTVERLWLESFCLKAIYLDMHYMK